MPLALSKLPVSNDNRTYFIIRTANAPTTSLPDYRQQIIDAMKAWENASNFTFVELQPGGNYPTYPSGASGKPRIDFAFGSDMGLATAQTADSGPGQPKTITFDSERTWRSMRALAKDYQEGKLPNEPLAMGVNDLFTVAMHEIGHALGLDHNSDMSSIMYDLDVYADPNGIAITQNNVPVMDAESLAKLYPETEKLATVSVPEGGAGYLIVGGKFCITDVQSRSLAQPDPQTVWDITTDCEVLAGNG